MALYGFETGMAKLEIDFLDDYSNEAIAEELKRIAKSLGKDSVSKKDIETCGKLSYSVINKHFGSLRKALEFSGLTPQRYMEEGVKRDSMKINGAYVNELYMSKLL